MANIGPHIQTVTIEPTHIPVPMPLEPMPRTEPVTAPAAPELIPA